MVNIKGKIYINDILLQRIEEYRFYASDGGIYLHINYKDDRGEIDSRVFHEGDAIPMLKLLDALNW